MAIDGYVETETVEDAYIAHHQRDIPVLLGWNADEGVDLAGLLAGLTGEQFRKALKEMFAPYPVPPGLEARYPSSTDEQTRVSKIRAMQDWMGYLMWHWDREQGSILSINSRSLVCSGPP